MHSLELQSCSRCNETIACNIGNIAQCACSQIVVPADVVRYIERNYAGCLCLKCLADIRSSIAIDNSQKPE